MYFVYIIKSFKTRRYYIGHCKDIKKRIKSHNSGKVRATKNGRPWELIHREKYGNKNEAYKRERLIKSFKSGNAFKKLISEVWQSG